MTLLTFSIFVFKINLPLLIPDPGEHIGRKNTAAPLKSDMSRRTNSTEFVRCAISATFYFNLEGRAINGVLCPAATAPSTKLSLGK